jgi:hypothetical protein
LKSSEANLTQTAILEKMKAESTIQTACMGFSLFWAV